MAALPWVEKQSIDFPSKTATIVVNERYDAAATLKAIQDIGFGAKVL